MAQGKMQDAAKPSRENIQYIKELPEKVIFRW